MKHFLLFISFLLCFSVGNAQTGPTTQRRINFNFITRDSINLALSENFELIEDSCNQIIRYARVDLQQRKFMGKVTDVSKANPALIITDGYYNANGLKDGLFTTHFLNGKLQARGNFKNGLFDGKWEVFYDNEKPRITFEANANDIKVIDVWDNQGKKIVDNGKGSYRVDQGDIYWKGKLLNGRPDGSWKAIRADDISEVSLSTESFKNNVFQKGNGGVGAYTDSSRINLLPADMLPFTRAEWFQISMTPCNGAKSKHIVDAQYFGGFDNLSAVIQARTTEAFKDIDLLRLPFYEIVLTGEISTAGALTRLSTKNNNNDQLVRNLISQLQRLPVLHPATVDGVPVVQKFAISYTFNAGVYSFSYRFLPVEVK